MGGDEWIAVFFAVLVCEAADVLAGEGVGAVLCGVVVEFSEGAVGEC